MSLDYKYILFSVFLMIFVFNPWCSWWAKFSLCRVYHIELTPPSYKCTLCPYVYIHISPPTSKEWSQTATRLTWSIFNRGVPSTRHILGTRPIFAVLDFTVWLCTPPITRSCKNLLFFLFCYKHRSRQKKKKNINGL